MKKINGLFAGLSLAIIMLFASSYTGRPLFGNGTNEDNTGRQLTYGSLVINDTAASTPDTITIVPTNYDRYYTVNLTDSCVIAIKSTGSAFTYSHIHFIINAATGGTWVKFLGYSGLTSQWLPSTAGTSKFTVTPSHTAAISWICTGTKYAEIYRSQD